MTTNPLPLTDPPHDTVRPPEPRPGEDHKTHLSGGARYAIRLPDAVAAPASSSAAERPSAVVADREPRP